MAHGFDLKALPADFIDNPFPYYRALREHDPIHRMPDGAYLVTRYAECEAVYKDTQTFSSDKRIEFRPKFGDSPLYQHHTTSLVFNDPPLHTHVRRAIIAALSARAIAEMEAGLVDLVDRLIARMAERGRADLIEDFSAAIPVEIIGNLLGIPRGERGPLRGWSLAILGERRRLIADPDLMKTAVEEVLRFESSNQLGNRIVASATVLAGVPMPIGTLVTIGIGAANRDPAQFPDADRFNVARIPNRHLAFGSGIHLCAGMNLARLEGRIAIGRFLRRFPHYELDGEPVRSRRARFRGFVSIPVRLAAAV